MNSPDFKAPSDLMQFVIDATKKTGEGRSIEYQLNAIIGTGRASLFTTGNTIYHLIYDLATHPEYIEPLRQELRELGDVPMTRANVGKLIKMDSFIRESQRWNKFMLGMCRQIMYFSRTLFFELLRTHSGMQIMTPDSGHFPQGYVRHDAFRRYKASSRNLSGDQYSKCQY